MNGVLIAWLAASLLDQPAREINLVPGIEVVRSDIGELAVGRSNWGTPLRLGDQTYERGLGTHCVSEILVRLPSAGVSFDASVGLDSDPTILGRGGSVVFGVEIAGKCIWRSSPCVRGENPIPVHVDLQGTREFTLKVLEVERGYNHADWAEPVVMLADGKRVDVSELPILREPSLPNGIPFSFSYGGRASGELLATWPRTVKDLPGAEGKRRRAITFTDPETSLCITMELSLFDSLDAVEWVLYLENTGNADTPLLESIRPLDLTLRTPAGNEVLLHSLRGSSASERDFLPVAEPLDAGCSLTLSPAGGLSSGGAWESQTDGRMPFFNIEWNGGGLVAAIGWSGQWEFTASRGAPRRAPLEEKQLRTPEEERELRAQVLAERAFQRGRDLHVQAGQQTTHFVLHPGERIRTPRALVALWEGDEHVNGFNLLRRILIDHHIPRRNGEVLLPPVSAMAIRHGQDFDSTNEANQIEGIERMSPLGVEAYWHDTAWFTGGFPQGIGNWSAKPDAFPNGLRPLSEAAKLRGMDFVLWFDLERVVPGTETVQEHPEWVLHAGSGDGLFNLGDPEAFAWLLEQVSRCISNWGVTIFRQDCTIRPLAFWRAADAPDRQGITEIRHIENLYALWDALRERHPGLLIDNCAGGGCRLDLETLSRSWPLWRSDTQIFGKPYAAWNQAQTASLSLCVPLHATGVWAYDSYNARSVFTTGGVILGDVRLKEFPAGEVEQALNEVKELRPYWLGDFYPLTEIDTDERHWCGWQLDRPDLGSGCFVLFRRSECPFPSMEIALSGIAAGATYEVKNVDRGETRMLSGAELARMTVTIERRERSVLHVYRRLADSAR